MIAESANYANWACGASRSALEPAKRVFKNSAFFQFKLVLDTHVYKLYYLGLIITRLKARLSLRIIRCVREIIISLIH